VEVWVFQFRPRLIVGEAGKRVDRLFSRSPNVYFAPFERRVVLGDMEIVCETQIGRPRSLVAAYMFDPGNDAKWTAGVISCRPLAEGRLRPGSRVERTVKFGSRVFRYEYKVTAASGDEFVEMDVHQPFPIWIRYELEEGVGGTRARIHTRADPKGFFRLAAPLMNRSVRKNISSDLSNLKAQLESAPK